MMAKKCAFTGHRAAKLPWGYNESDPRCIALKAEIQKVISAIYESGIDHFICGMANGCDIYFGECVMDLKSSHPEVILEAAIPYEGQSESLKLSEKRRYQDIVRQCDIKTVLSEKYHRGCMMNRNRYMVDNCDILIACFNGQTGGTMNTIRYAMKLDREIIQITI